MLRKNENKSNKLMKLVLSLFPLGLILINIKLFDIGATALKPIHVIVIMTIILGISEGISFNKFILLLIYAVIPLFSIINIVSLSAFMSTYLIYLMSLMLIFIGVQPVLKYNSKDIQRLFQILFRSFNLTAIYGIIQFILANVFNNFSLYNNLGRFQFHHHFKNQILGIQRATSIYTEPSVYSWISVTIIALVLFLMNTQIIKIKETYLTLLLGTVSVLISFSASGLISFFFLLALFIFGLKRNYLNLIFQILIILIVICNVVFQPENFQYLRLSEIGHQNTSGYARLIEPFYAMKDVLSIYPFFGRGLGQIGVFDSNLSYNIYIHNSLYGTVITFGISIIFYFIPIVFSFYRMIKRDIHTVILIVNLIMIFLSTGSFLSLEMPLIYCLYLFAIRYKTKK